MVAVRLNKTLDLFIKGYRAPYSLFSFLKKSDGVQFMCQCEKTVRRLRENDDFLCIFLLYKIFLSGFL